MGVRVFALIGGEILSFQKSIGNPKLRSDRCSVSNSDTSAKVLASERNTLRFATLVLLAALTPVFVAASADKTKVDVTVIENIPTTLTYDWQVAGRGSVNCSGSSCISFFSPASSGTSQVSGAILKLLMPDGRIVIAACAYNKGNLAFGMIGAMTGDAHLNSPRNCAVPQLNDLIHAEFSGSLVKLLWRLPSLDGKGLKASESYVIRGVLKPVASLQTDARTASSKPTQIAARDTPAVARDTPAKSQDQPLTDGRINAKLLVLSSQFLELKNEAAKLAYLAYSQNALNKRCSVYSTMTRVEKQDCWESRKILTTEKEKHVLALISLIDAKISQLRSGAQILSSKDDENVLLQMREQLDLKSQQYDLSVASSQHHVEALIAAP